MRETIRIIPMALYMMVGIISLIMAYKSIFSKKLLPFHEQASGTSWDKIDRNLQMVVTALMRVSGLGFMVMAFLLMVFPVANYFSPVHFINYAVPFISVLYCAGLFVVNYSLHKATKVKTPWKGALSAVFILVMAMALSSI